MKYGNKYIMYDLARWARKEIRRALAKGLFGSKWKLLSRWFGSRV